jgi:DNA-binding NarL/FixJ family response regulator
MADVDRAYELGANGYLVKSVDHENLVEALKRVRNYWLDLNVNPSRPTHERTTSVSDDGSRFLRG